NADDAGRYRDEDEVARWLARDPVSRLRQYLTGRGLLDDAAIAAVDAEAEEQARELRERMATDPGKDPAELFRHVYAEPTAALRGQRDELARELSEQARP